MQDFETLCFQNREDWLRLLLAYAQAEEAAALAEAALAKSALPQSASAPAPAVSAAPGSDHDAEEGSTGWVSRIAMLDGVETSQMSTLHGRVIALGYLKFKLIDRQVGLRYRLTPSGKQLVHSQPEPNTVAA